LTFLGIAQQVSSTSDFTELASPTAVSVATGSSGTSTITTTSIGGFNSAISLSASGAPSGMMLSFNPTSIFRWCWQFDDDHGSGLFYGKFSE
jgi:hypothetical protein